MLLLQLLRLLLMLLLHLLFFGLIRLLLREFRVILLLLLLDCSGVPAAASRGAVPAPAGACRPTVGSRRVEQRAVAEPESRSDGLRGGAGRLPGAGCEALFGFIGRSAGRSTGRFVGVSVFGVTGLLSAGLAVLDGAGRSGGRFVGSTVVGVTGLFSTGLAVLGGIGRRRVCGLYGVRRHRLVFNWLGTVFAHSAGRSGGRAAFGATACVVLIAGTARVPCCG